MSTVRKAYFKMSMKYHPDKNPEGRVCRSNARATSPTLAQEMFEKVNKAYEFVTAKEQRCDAQLER